MTVASDHGATLREVEKFLFVEADLLDDWLLPEWLDLWTRDALYLVPPLGSPAQMNADPAKVLFLIADNRSRLEQRVVRLMKDTAYAEYPHSRTRHFLSNIRILQEEAGEIVATANFMVHRSKDAVSHSFVGRQRSILQRSPNDGRLRIAEKRCCLDLDSLSPQGKLSLIL